MFAENENEFTQKAIYYSQLLEENENENPEEIIITAKEKLEENQKTKETKIYNLWIEPTYLHPILTTLFNCFIPGLSKIVSIFLSGLGHIFMGQIQKGTGLIVIYICITSFIIISCFFLIGFLMLPFLFFYLAHILKDGYILSTRARSGLLVMEGECTSSIVKFGLSKFVNKESVIFNNTKKDECPKQWIYFNQN